MFPRQPNNDKKYEEERTNVRKSIRREIEKQRRQEMANLCGSLRTLLPVQYNNKGKRSVSDRMQEAVNYIKDMQVNIHQLKNRRDKLKKWIKLGERDEYRNCVAVNPCSDGVEVLINVSFEDEEGQQYFPLSIILKELVERGFDVVSCTSTNTDHGRSLHKIRLEIWIEQKMKQEKIAENLMHQSISGRFGGTSVLFAILAVKNQIIGHARIA